MLRKEFPKSVKLAAFERCEGRCERCGAALFAGQYHYDHVLADGLSGKPTLENCAVLCRACHGLKTNTEDIPRMAKADRTRRKIMDGEKKKSRLWNPRWKRKVSGEVVER